MSASTKDLTQSTGGSSSIPNWIAAGVLGLAIGAGGTFLGMHYYFQNNANDDSAATAGAAGASVAGAATSPMPMGGGGGGMMMGMGGGGGAGGGGGGGGGKRNLTSLVGKLELLSRADLKLNVELDAEQGKAVAAKLQEIEQAETMTGEEAQSHLDALEALLTAEQKTTLGLIGLPFVRPGAGLPTAPIAGGPPGAGGPPMLGAGGMGGGQRDDNPFTQETNQKRLRDLLGRLVPVTDAPVAPAETPAPPDVEKPAEAKGDS